AQRAAADDERGGGEEAPLAGLAEARQQRLAVVAKQFLVHGRSPRSYTGRREPVVRDRGDSTGAGLAARGSGSGLGLQVVLEPEALDQLELGFQPVDVLLLGLQDRVEEVPGDVILARFAVGDRRLQVDAGVELEVQIR